MQACNASCWQAYKEARRKVGLRTSPQNEAQLTSPCQAETTVHDTVQVRVQEQVGQDTRAPLRPQDGTPWMLTGQQVMTPVPSPKKLQWTEMQLMPKDLHMLSFSSSHMLNSIR